jgi:hypothetical protein
MGGRSLRNAWTHFVNCPMPDCVWTTIERSPYERLAPHKAIKMHERAIRHLRTDHLRKGKGKT